LAIIPLAKLIGDSTEEIALRTNQTLGGLLNATFGNAVELILGIIALTHGLLTVVQASLLGSILSNLLLVMGMCFVFGGARYKEQTFNRTAANTSGSILFVACFALIVPAALNAQLTPNITLPNVASFNSNESLTQFLNGTYNIENQSMLVDAAILAKLLILSRGTAIILLIIYVLYLIFQLVTHKHLYEEIEDDEEEEDPKMNLPTAILTLLVATVLVGICSEFLVDSIGGIVKEWGVSPSFIGLILIPIIGNAAEHLTAVSVAWKNKMDLAIGVALGSSIQIALLVTPILILVGWGIGQPLTFFYQTFETAVMFISVIVVNSLISDGESNWFEGSMLCAIYIILAIAFYQLD